MIDLVQEAALLSILRHRRGVNKIVCKQIKGRRGVNKSTFLGVCKVAGGKQKVCKVPKSKVCKQTDQIVCKQTEFGGVK